MKNHHTLAFFATTFALLFVFHSFYGRIVTAQTEKRPAVDSMVIEPALELQNSFIAIANHVRPSVVSVYSEKIVKYRSPEGLLPFGDEFFRRFFGDEFQPQMPEPMPRERNVPMRGVGSGLILDSQGHILTNYHVIQDVSRIQVQLADRRNYEAKVIGVDPQTDVAVIRMQGNFPKNLPAKQLSDSTQLRVGEMVIAVGAPFGLPQTVTQGIVSATGRANVGIVDYEDFIQTDAPINPGNSGGPLVNMHGDVIGLNTAIATAGLGQYSGVGFAIPSTLINSMLGKLLKGQTITRGQLGVIIQDLNEDLAREFKLKSTNGVLISQVVKNSAAEKGGLRAGDVILEYNDQAVSDSTDLRKRIATTEPGTKVKIDFVRNQDEKTTTVEIGKQEPVQKVAAQREKQASGSLGKIGISLTDLDPSTQRNLGINQGAMIVDVSSGSPAWRAGLQPGDVIIEADRRQVKNAAQLVNLLSKMKANDSVLLLVRRQAASLYIVLELAN